jgi:transcriptional regulator with XRE-family HTH domain
VPVLRQRGVVWMRLHKEGRKRLAKLMLIQGISHRQLASACGWKSHGMVGHLVSGRKVGVEKEAALIIAKVLGVDVGDLFLTEIPANRDPRKAASAA